MNNDLLLNGLNDPQIEAVCAGEGPLLVLAGPGSGKTRVITHRIAHLIQNGVRPSRILALTFTNKAADEMKSRLQLLVPEIFVWIGTFHKFCASLLRQYAGECGLSPNYSIYDTDESGSILKKLLNSSRQPPGVSLQGVQSAISWAKNGLIPPEDYLAKPGSILGMVVEEVYPKYQKELGRANAVDFDDLLMDVALLLQKNEEIRAKLDDRYRYVLVDEYQDTNLVQYAIARSLSRDHSNLMVSGDPDQSIYGWRGANIRNILDFEKDFPTVKTIRLEQNYRSTKRILAVADTLIRFNRFRKDKDLYTDNNIGEKVRLVIGSDQQEEADVIAEEIAREIAEKKRKPADYAIFYRTNALSRNLEHSLRRHNVPFQLVRGLEFYRRKEVKDLVSYLQLVHNPRDTISFERIVNEPRRGIGRTTLKKISDYGSNLGISTLDAAREVVRAKSGGISTKARKAIEDFIAMIERLQTEAEKDYPVESMISLILKETKYEDQYRLSESEEDTERLENIQELLSAARDFDRMDHSETENPIEAFLEQAALTADTDAWDTETDKVSLMTLHAAKGLEFPVVYIIAIEEGILPHERSNSREEQAEEERRLFFVGLTRAEEELRLSYAARRGFRGSFNNTISSRFLLELPRETMWILNDPGSITQRIKAGENGDVRIVYDHDAIRSQEYDQADEASDNFEVYEEYEDVHIEYDEDGNAVERKPKRKSKRKLEKREGNEMLLSLTTGQELLKRKIAPLRLEPGMMVRHENYGTGFVEKVLKETARIMFFSDAGVQEVSLRDENLEIIPGRTR